MVSSLGEVQTISSGSGAQHGLSGSPRTAVPGLYFR